jgi:glyoxylate reductase
MKSSFFQQRIMTAKTRPTSRNIFITGPLPEDALRLLSHAGRVRFHRKKESLTPEVLHRHLKTADALVCFPNDRIDEAAITSAPRLRIIASASAAFHHIDTAFAQKRGIWVTNTPDIVTESTADLTFGLLLSAARHIVAADRFLRQGNFRGWDYFLFQGVRLSGKTLGIVGMGRIGQAVAERARGFGLKIRYTNRVRLSSEREQALGAQYVPFSRLLRQSDFLSLHVPLTSTTRHLIGTAQLSAMKKSAILINTSRGAVVDEKALARALKTGQIAAAGLDVYEYEPYFEKALLALDNIVLLPHIGSATKEARQEIALTAVRNVLAVLRGKNPMHPVVIPEILKA